jgi:putative peptidoglycan lipid II flippase
MSKMLKSSGAMALATLISRILGMVREMVYANFMGTDWVAGAFKFAFMVPNLFRRLLGEGALTAAFVPIFKEKEKAGTRAEMWQAANAVLSALLVLAGATIVVVLLGISVALRGWEFAVETRLMLELLRLMFPYMVLACVTALFMAMLNARGHFFIPALGATVLNVVMIGSVFWLAPLFGQEVSEQVFALAFGVLIAGVLQAGLQLPLLLRGGYRFRWVTPWRDSTVRTVGRRMIPGTLGVAAYHVNILVTLGVAFAIDAPIVAAFDYAVRLMELPQGLFVVSLATFLLPTLSGLAAEKKYPEFRQTISQALSYLLFINLFATLVMVLQAEAIIRLLYQRGRFGPFDTGETALALVFLAPALLGFSVVNVVARAFYALGDTSTPMRVSVLCLGVNLVLTLLFIWPLRQGGLGLANSISSLLNAGLLIYALRRKMGRLDLAGLMAQLPKLAVAGFVGGFVVWFVSRYWADQWGHGSLSLKLGEVFVPMLAAGLAYLGCGVLLRVPAARDLLGLLRIRSFEGDNDGRH